MTLNLIYNELRLQVMEMKQYWFETVSGLLFVIAVFLGLFYGVKGFVVEQGDNQSLDGLLFGFLLWSFATSAYSSVTKSIIEDTQRGYIEQLFLCPQGIVRLLLSRSVAELLTGIIMLIGMAYITMWLTGNWLDINFLYFFAILFLAAPSLIGLGLIISGFALVFKKVETLGALLTIGLMGLVALDGLPLNVFTFLPFVAGASLAREVVLEQLPANGLYVGIVALNSALYLAAGWQVFRLLERMVKRRNLIGQY
ncbi:ABC transporter permease [Alteromonas flava]|uniref:ABC transporter permease n=1 Tax=Alteromonas flava TaxID=2048003 RepID=UPI000C284B7A|nr:ABC transporter permease [Alteromonas flava]